MAENNKVMTECNNLKMKSFHTLVKLNLFIQFL